MRNKEFLLVNWNILTKSRKQNNLTLARLIINVIVQKKYKMCQSEWLELKCLIQTCKDNVFKNHLMPNHCWQLLLSSHYLNTFLHNYGNEIFLVFYMESVYVIKTQKVLFATIFRCSLMIEIILQYFPCHLYYLRNTNTTLK